MANKSRQRNRSTASTALQVRDLHIYYGQSHALQGVDLTVDHGIHAVVGRNGMGKTTLCKAIMGLLPSRRGSIRFRGEEIIGLAPHKIASQGVGYTPQGRRLWPSLSVDEHLRLTESGRGAWTIERIYETFPRLYERRRNGGGQLSGGEQQMLAISRALLQDSQLLVLDEPTEGLAPLIVDQLEKLLAELVAESDVAILLIEQNIAVATSIAKDVAIMVNGRISRIMSAQQLAADRTLQERLLGVGRHSHEDIDLPTSAMVEPSTVEVSGELPEPDIVPIEKPEEKKPLQPPEHNLSYLPPTRWSNASWKKQSQASANPSETKTEVLRPFDDKPQPLFKEPDQPFDTLRGDEIIVAGTFDTKAIELNYIRDRILLQGLRVRRVDLSTSGKPSSADVPPHLVAVYHPGGSNAVFTGDRGASVRTMSEAFVGWIKNQNGIAGIISAAGSGGTALVTPAMRGLPVGLPKLMISTVASGDVGQYVGPTDITMMYSVTDVQGLNQISKQILANGANAITGMVKNANKTTENRPPEPEKPALGLTMFGVTTSAVQQITAELESRYDCLVFHATGTGGQSMEKLADSGILSAAIDLTTTEICDMMMGGVFAANEDRFGAFIRSQIPYVGSVGALDMVNFGSRNSIPEHYSHRNFVEHNPQVTLMRTTAEENARMGRWIAERLNEMTGPVRFLIPEAGVSALDLKGQAFFDPEADRALFDAIAQQFRETAKRRLIHTPYHINDAAFCRAIVDALNDINPEQMRPQYATS